MVIALFRVQELANGTIFIDGVDIATLPIRELRKQLGIIPQDPVRQKKNKNFIYTTIYSKLNLIFEINLKYYCRCFFLPPLGLTLTHLMSIPMQICGKF
jgi:hypothetical protein